MAALVQTLPVQTTTITMLGRPSSAGAYPQSTGAYPPQPSQQQSRTFQANRYNNVPATGYRGLPATGPVAPYAFTSTPQLANAKYRATATSTGKSASAPKVPQVSQSSSQPSSPIGLPQIDAGSRLSMGLPTIPTTGSLMGPSQSPVTVAKPSPDRYRRNGKRVEGESGPNRVAAGSALPSGSGMAAVGSLYSHPSQSSSTPSLSSQTSYRGSAYGTTGSKNSSADDLHVGRNQTPDLAARYRRRSLGNIETAGLIHSTDAQDTSSPHPNAFLSHQQTPQAQQTQPSQQTQPNHVQGQRPAHSHTASSDSRTSSRSGRSSRPGSVSLSPSFVSSRNHRF